MRVAEALASTRSSLEAATPDAAIEAEVLVRHASRLDRAALYASLGEPLAPAVRREVASLVGRRLSGEPLAYITGRREFYGLDLRVTPDVLVPRQETETLVERVVEFVESRGCAERVTIADVGTGSGAIAAALATQLRNATVVGTELSARALKVADGNLRRLGLRHRVQLVMCDLLDGLKGPFDVIVSNPPYIATADMDGLPAGRAARARPVAGRRRRRTQGCGEAGASVGGSADPGRRPLCRDSPGPGASGRRDGSQADAGLQGDRRRRPDGGAPRGGCAVWEVGCLSGRVPLGLCLFLGLVEGLDNTADEVRRHLFVVAELQGERAQPLGL